jgi:prevent-host-death family protein
VLMRKIGAYEAKTHLPKLLERVSRGERFIITKHGVAVAELIPTSSKGKQSAADAIAEIRKFAKRHSLGKLSLRKLIEEGRR